MNFIPVFRIPSQIISKKLNKIKYLTIYPWISRAVINNVRQRLPAYAKLWWSKTSFTTTLAVQASMAVAYCYVARDKDLNNEFFDAVVLGDTCSVRRLIDDGFDVNMKHPLGWRALHTAANARDHRMIKLLLERGVDPDFTDEFITPFKVSRKHGMSTFEVLHMREEQFGQRLNPRQSFEGFTPLHYAALSEDFESIKLLLDSGCDPTIKDKEGRYAFEYCDNPSHKQMIESGMDNFKKKKAKLEAEERRRYPLEQRFKEVIVGQEGAINIVASAVRRKENGWYDEEHPLVFLFLGSSGIGKTELAKQLATYLHKDTRKGFIRLDMSEYQGKHEVAKLIGAPPGYIGHDQGGQLTKKLKEFPKAVVLFDEVDKAHPDVLTCLLQLFDEGRLTDGHGKTIECKDAVFVMTSNLASGEIARHAIELREAARKVTKQKQSIKETSEEVTLGRKFKEDVVYPILKSHFQRDEFLGRITEFVYFLPFSYNELTQLVDRELQFWAKRAEKNHNIVLSWDSEVLKVLASGYDVHYGARSIKHEVERRVINQIATAHERNLIDKNSKIHIVADFSNNPVDKSMKHYNRANSGVSVKLQLIEAENKKDIVLENLYDPDIPIYF